MGFPRQSWSLSCSWFLVVVVVVVVVVVELGAVKAHHRWGCPDFQGPRLRGPSGLEFPPNNPPPRQRLDFNIVLCYWAMVEFRAVPRSAVLTYDGGRGHDKGTAEPPGCVLEPQVEVYDSSSMRRTNLFVAETGSCGQEDEGSLKKSFV